MIDISKQNLVCYSHPPVSIGVQFIHRELFHLINVFKQKYNVFVVSRSQECFDFYQQRFAPLHPEVNFIPVPKNVDEEDWYTMGLLDDEIEKSTHGKIDKVFVFSAGMSAVTPENLIHFYYNMMKSNSLVHGNTIQLKKEIEQPTFYEAEFLYSTLKHNPKFYHRVVDYTEPHIDKATGYPTKLLSYYATPELNHNKFHDSELFFVSDIKEPVEKTLDFLFAFSVEIPERAYMTEFAKEHIEENEKFKLCIKDKYYSKYAPIDTTMQSDKYYDLLRYAKFSLVAPSTNPTELSLYRVYDDLAARCIPLFMKNVQYWKGFEDDVNEFIKNNLIYDEEKWPKLNDFIATLDYEKLYSDLMNIPSMKRNFDKEWIYNKILEEID